MYSLFKIIIFITFVFRTHESIIKDPNQRFEETPYCDRYSKQCYNTHISDDIPSIDDGTAQFAEDSIFFIEDSCKGGLDLRQACSVEAAARLHPARDVVVLFLGPVTAISLSTSLSWEILKYKNVKLYRVNVDKHLRNTPLEFMPKEDRQCLVRTLSDVLIFATLYKYGGVYLDLNMLLSQSLELLPQEQLWVAKSDNNTIGAGLLALTTSGTGQMMSDLLLRMYMDSYRMHNYHDDTDDIINDAMKNMCQTEDVEDMTSRMCKGITIYDPSYFYPIKYKNRRRYFERSKVTEIPEKPFGFYIWEGQSRHRIVKEDSLYARIMNEFCPMVKNVTNELTGYIVE